MPSGATASSALANTDSLPTFEQTYITPHQLATELRMSLRTLQRLYDRRVGPPRIAVGRTILYRRTAVDEWLRKQECNPIRSTFATRSKTVPSAPATAHKRNHRRDAMRAQPQRAKVRA